MKLFKNKSIKVIIIELLVIIIGVIGITFALGTIFSSIGITIATSKLEIEDIGAVVSSDTLVPLDDSTITSSTTSGVLRITFSVKGVSTNNTTNPIYDVVLNDIVADDEILGTYTKWNLYKNNTLLTSGSLSPTFDNSINDNKLKLTETQQDLPSSTSTADSYVFILWLSESCTGDITQCTEDSDIPSGQFTVDGDITIQLYSGNKKSITRVGGYEKSNLVKSIKKAALGSHTLSEIPLVDGEENFFEDGSFAVIHHPAATNLVETYSYRFIGTNPNNFIYFNCTDYSNPSSSTCELWRIVSVEEVNVPEGGTQYLTKIMRYDDIGSYSFDNRDTTTGAETNYGSNDWTTARLMKLLNPGYTGESANNSLYYTRSSGTCYNGANNATESCDFTSTGLKSTSYDYIKEVIWNVGRLDGNDVSVAMYRANKIYLFQNGNNTCSLFPVQWQGKIGLITFHDFAYSEYKINDGIYIITNDRLYNKPWMDRLADQEFWTMSFTNDSASGSEIYSKYYREGEEYDGEYVVYSHYSIGNILPARARLSNNTSSFRVYPTLYLTSDTKIVGGKGTEDEPILIGK